MTRAPAGRPPGVAETTAENKATVAAAAGFMAEIRVVHAALLGAKEKGGVCVVEQDVSLRKRDDGDMTPGRAGRVDALINEQRPSAVGRRHVTLQKRASRKKRWVKIMMVSASR